MSFRAESRNGISTLEILLTTMTSRLRSIDKQQGFILLQSFQLNYVGKLLQSQCHRALPFPNFVVKC